MRILAALARRVAVTADTGLRGEGSERDLRIRDGPAGEVRGPRHILLIEIRTDADQARRASCDVRGPAGGDATPTRRASLRR